MADKFEEEKTAKLPASGLENLFKIFILLFRL